MLLALGAELLALARQERQLVDVVEFNKIIGMILEIFILVELFRIAVAYMRHIRVVPTVLEAALVAVARKFVVFEGGNNYLSNALGLSALSGRRDFVVAACARRRSRRDIEDDSTPRDQRAPPACPTSCKEQSP